MALYTVQISSAGSPDVVSLTDGSTYATLEVSAGRGPKGDGWTGVTYDNNTGRFTFTSTDGLGYVSDSITGDLDTAVTEAEAAQAAAEAAQAATENIFDQFGDQYLGPKASDPTVDNDGDPLTEGDIYFNTTDDVLKFYSGTAWVAPEVIATNAAQAAQAAQAAAETAETNAEMAETNASTSETNASTSETNAASSASAAATSASEAAASAASINPDNIDINGGTIDGTVIGGTTPAAGSFTDITATGTVDGRDVASDGTKLDGIEAGADVTDTANVTAAGALMDSEVTNLAQVKAFDSADYATAAQGTLADSAVQPNDSPTFAGLTTTGDVSFGDNDKAIFGAGSDLQIYHDGSASHLQEVGTGNLTISGTSINFNNNDIGGRYAEFVSNGAVNLFHAGSRKLATTSTGVDVTGTVTADGLTVDGDGEYNNTSASVGGKIYLDGRTANTGDDVWDLQFRNTVSGVVTDENAGSIRVEATNARRQYDMIFSRSNSGTQTDAMRIDFNGDISFYEDTGTTPKFFWDASAESLGIGTSSPSGKLEIANSDQTNGVTLSLTNSFVGSGWSSGDIIGSVDFRIDDASTSEPVRGRIKVFDDTTGSGTYPASTAMSFSTANFDTLIERMRIDSSGNVGIGTSSPAYNLELSNTGGDANIGITASASGLSQVLFTDGSIAGKVAYRHPTNSMEFTVNGSEAMRIDSSGNLLVGKTAATISTDGAELRPTGEVVATTNGLNVAYFNRRSSDGSIAEFRKDGSTVGSIGSYFGDLYIASPSSTDAGLGFGASNIRPVTTSGAYRDNAIDLGIAASRFKDLYLSGGVYLGGTGSANKLDDYEEGFWTPALVFDGASTGITYSDRIGYYTKIGNVVYARWGFRLSNKGTSTGNAEVSGLPFNIRTGTYADAAGTASGGSYTGLTSQPNTLGRNNSDRFFVRDYGSTGGVSLTEANFTNNTYFFGVFVYDTTA